MLARLSIATLSVLTLACGAPVKSAGDVASLFSAGGEPLHQKVEGLCATLANRDAAPDLKTSGINRSDCDDPGKYAINFQSADKFHFQGLDDKEFDDDVTTVSVRSQAWLGKSLLGLATAVAGKMKENQGTGAGGFDIGGSGGPSDGLIDLETEFIREPKFDIDTFSFGMEIGIKGDGIVSLDNKIAADGTLLDGNFAVSIYTTEDGAEDKTLLRSIKGAVFIVPHASDVYVDLFLNVEVYKIGLVDGVIKGQLKSIMGGAFKDILNTALGL
jgi:hypothetical protein